MADKKKHVVRMLRRAFELGRFSIGSEPMCIPVTCEDSFRFNTVPVIVQRPSQDSSMGAPLRTRDVPDKGGSWKKKLGAFLPPIMNPLAKVVRHWNQFFAISCLLAIFIDPLFFFLLSMDKDNKCIVFSLHFLTALIVARSVTDAIYFLNIFLQFRMAFVDPESRVVGTGDIVDEPKKVAMHYFRGAFLIDVILMLPVPQVMIWLVIPKYVGVSSANFVKNMLRATILLQYAPRIFRFLPLLGGQSANGFVFESAWANFVINLLIFLLAGHVVGSFWYLFGLQSVNQCLRNACVALKITPCAEFIDCGYGINELDRGNRQLWFNNSISQSCFDTTIGSFKYGIYEQAVLLTALLQNLALTAISIRYSGGFSK